MIKIRNLYKSFKDNQVLKGFDLELYDGETLAIIGKSGCGKSVLLKNILGLMKPDMGSVFIDGNDITKMNLRQLQKIRLKFGMLFQSSALFDSMTVEQNVGIALRRYLNLSEKEVKRKISYCLNLVGLSKIENLFPSELSGGMKKRVGLARAIAMDPKYILYDEPTTGLDPVTGNLINENIIRLKKELNVNSIVVTHDMHCVYLVADRISMLNDGKIVFTGTPDEIKETSNNIVKEFLIN